MRFMLVITTLSYNDVTYHTDFSIYNCPQYRKKRGEILIKKSKLKDVENTRFFSLLQMIMK